MELNFKSFGQGDPVIILHGLFGMLDNWQTIARQLADNYSVYLVDQRNHGRSPHDPVMNYTAMAEDLSQFMEANWIHQAHIIGHSMGGKTAMEFALLFPDMVDKLVVIDIAPKKYPPGHNLIFEALRSIDINQLESRRAASEQLAIRIKDQGVLQFLLKNLTRKKQGGFQWKMNLDVIYNNYDNILAALATDDVFTGPTLFIKGGKSEYIEEQDFSQIKERFSNSSVQAVENAGHWVHAEAPKELLSLLVSFFEEPANS